LTLTSLSPVRCTLTGSVGIEPETVISKGLFIEDVRSQEREGFAQCTTVRDEMFLGIQDFNFCPNLISFTQFLKINPNWPKLCSNLPKKFARGCSRISYATGGLYSADNEGSTDADLHIFGATLSGFRNFSVSAPTRGKGGLSQCRHFSDKGGGGHFSAILYANDFYGLPLRFPKTSKQTTFQKSIFIGNLYHFKLKKLQGAPEKHQLTILVWIR